MEDLALDRPTLQHPPLGRFEAVQAGREQRPQRGRHLDLVPGLVRHRDHLMDEQRIASGSGLDPYAKPRRYTRPDQGGGFLPCERLQPHGHRPGGAAVKQLRARHAQDQQWRRGREERQMLDQVEERLRTPLDVVEHDHERRLLLEQLPERPRDLLRRGPRIRLAQQRPDRARGRGIRRHHVELLDHLHHGPVRDPRPVGQTASSHDSCVDRRQSLRRQPRLPDPRITNHRHELTTLLPHGTSPRVRQQPEFALPADKHRVVLPLRSRVRGEEPTSGNRLALPFQHKWLDCLGLDRRSGL